MTKAVKPVKVSPVIKISRWTLLIAGIIYGHMRKISLESFEKRYGKIREKQLQQKLDRLAKENHGRTVADVVDFCKEIDITEFPPGWDDEL